MLKIIRLGKLARDLNISISKIVETAQKLGFDIDFNPNTKIEKELHELLMKYLDDPNFDELLELIEKKRTRPKEKEHILTSFDLLKQIRKEKGKPKTIYKYFANNDYSLDGLKNNYLYFAHYEQFNDPFDCSRILIDINYKHRKEIKDAFEKGLFESLNNHGICCFSRTKDSVLMWSHYANKHEGFVIEFHCKDEEQSINPLDVNYIESFIKPDLINRTQDAIYHLIYSKAIEWEYEKELRWLKNVKQNNEEARKVNYKIEDIKAIYLGININEVFIKEIIEIVNKLNKKITLYRGYRQPNRFGINWVKYKGI